MSYEPWVLCFRLWLIAQGTQLTAQPHTIRGNPPLPRHPRCFSRPEAFTRRRRQRRGERLKFTADDADWADRCGSPPQRPDSLGFFLAIPSRLELSEGIGDAIKVIMSR